MIQVGHGFLTKGSVRAAIIPVQIQNHDQAIMIKQIHPVDDICLVLGHCFTIGRFAIDTKPAVLI